jgi:hypothetical protein
VQPSPSLYLTVANIDTSPSDAVGPYKCMKIDVLCGGLMLCSLLCLAGPKVARRLKQYKEDDTVHPIIGIVQSCCSKRRYYPLDALRIGTSNHA